MNSKFKTRFLLIVLIFSLLTAGCTKIKDTVDTNSKPPIAEDTPSTVEISTKPDESPIPDNTESTDTKLPETSAINNGYIFADSQIKKLSGDAIMRLQPELLPFALNEIFARRGYMFETKIFKDYFAQKPWYKADMNFNYNELTDIEFYNINLIKYFINKNQNAPAQKPPSPQVTIYKADTIVLFDLNGDGVNEKITYSPNKGEFSINNLIVKLNLDSAANSFAVADLDKDDNLKEVLISDYGPSDDYSTHYYSFHGTNVIDMGETQGLFDFGIDIDGSGRIAARTRGRILQTWFFKKSFQLNKKHMIEEVFQDLYSTDYDVFLKIPLKLYKNKGDTLPSLLAKEGQTVKIIGFDNKEWCLLRASDGTTGWIALDKFSIVRNNGLQAQDVFEGLCYAD